MEKKIILGGEHYTKASMELRGEGDGFEVIEEVLYDGRCNNDLYCISMLYDRCFDLNSVCIEDLSAMISDLDLGCSANFWVSCYQSADLLKKLKSSIYKGMTQFELNYGKHRLCLLQEARENFCRVPKDVSTVSLLDIEKEINCELTKNIKFSLGQVFRNGI